MRSYHQQQINNVENWKRNKKNTMCEGWNLAIVVEKMEGTPRKDISECNALISTRFMRHWDPRHSHRETKYSD